MPQSFWDMLRGRMPGETKAAASDAGIQKVGTQAPAPRRAAETAALIDAYTKNEIAFACVQIKRKAMQDPRLVVEERQGDGEWKEAPGHPLQRLMMRPMPDMDGATFLGLLVASLDIAGAFYAEKVRSKGGAVVGLNPLNPGCMSPWLDQQRKQIGWTWKRGMERVDFPYEDILVKPNTDWGGASPLSVALGAIDADTAQTDFIRAFFNNAGQPGGILKVKGTYDQNRADALSGKWSAKYGRRGDGWFRPAVLDDNAEYQRTGSLLNELDSESIRGLTESRICAPFGVPPLIVYAYVGLLRATYSNLKEAWASFWDAELSPALKALREFLTWHLLVEFVSEDLIYGERIRLRWDLSQVAALQEDVDAIAKRAALAWQAGGTTRAEYRTAIGEVPGPNDNFYILPTGVQVVAGDVLPEPAKDRTLVLDMKTRQTAVRG
jgi:HK97 family phage portal protein